MKARAAKAKEKSVPAGQFKAQCLALFDRVNEQGLSFVVTKRGRPVARVSPVRDSAGSLRGSLVYEEDLLTPVDVEWEAQR